MATRSGKRQTLTVLPPTDCIRHLPKSINNLPYIPTYIYSCIPTTIVLDVIAIAIYARNLTCSRSLLHACPDVEGSMRRGSVICRRAYDMNTYIHRMKYE